MQNRPVWFVGIHPGGAPVSGAIASPARIFGVAPKQSFLSARISASGIRKGKFAIARRARQRPRAHPSRVQSPVRLGFSASRRNSLFLARESRPVAFERESSRSRDALASVRDGRATQCGSPRF